MASPALSVHLVGFQFEGHFRGSDEPIPVLGQAPETPPSDSSKAEDREPEKRHLEEQNSRYRNPGPGSG